MGEDHGKPEERDLAFAEEVVEALSLLDALDEPAAAKPVSFAELYAYATDPGRRARPQLLDALAASPRLRADLQRLLSNTAVFSLPQVAAASSGVIERREGDGCRIEFRASRADPGQVYVIINLDERTPKTPSTLIIYGSEGRCV